MTALAMICNRRVWCRASWCMGPMYLIFYLTSSSSCVLLIQANHLKLSPIYCRELAHDFDATTSPILCATMLQVVPLLLMLSHFCISVLVPYCVALCYVYFALFTFVPLTVYLCLMSIDLPFCTYKPHVPIVGHIQPSACVPCIVAWCHSLSSLSHYL